MYGPQLDLCEGPECPRCHCQDAAILREPVEPAAVNPDAAGVWFSDGKARCNNCGAEFAFRAADTAQASGGR